MTSEQAYRKCVELERKREAFWRKTPQGRFESAFMSMDSLIDNFDDPSKIGAFSDHGECAWAIENFPLYKNKVSEYLKRLHAAYEKVRRVSADLIPTFLLILKYGANRDEAISIIQHRREKSRYAGDGCRQPSSDGPAGIAPARSHAPAALAGRRRTIASPLSPPSPAPLREGEAEG